jgi:hypothetical protein
LYTCDGGGVDFFAGCQAVSEKKAIDVVVKISFFVVEPILLRKSLHSKTLS